MSDRRLSSVLLLVILLLAATNVGTGFEVLRGRRELAELQRSYDEQHKALKEKSTVVAMLEEIGVPLTPIVGPPVPAIDARVAAVKSDVTPELVLLSAGSDDKVEKGFHFSIYRSSSFVGKVVVEKVLRDSCGCRVLFTKEGEHIQAGDSAATRLQ